MAEMYIQIVLAGKMAVCDIPEAYRQTVSDTLKQKYAAGEVTEETYNQIQWQL